MATRTSAIRIAVENMDASIAALKRGGEEGQKALERFGIGAGAANQNLERLGKTGAESGAGLRRFGILAQQGGYQLGDFAVQVQSGTNVVIAATQQISQFAGAFGLVGSAVGAAAAILGGAVSYFQKYGDTAGIAAKALNELTTATDEYKAALVGIEPLQIAALKQLLEMEQQANKTAKANRDVIESMPLVGFGGLGGEGPVASAGPLASSLSTAQQFEALIRARNKTLNQEFDAVLKYQTEQFDAYVRKYGGIPTPRGGIEGFRGAQDVGLAQGTDIELQRQTALRAEQERLNRTRESAAKAAAALAVQNAKLLDQAKLSTQEAQNEADALYMGEDARKRANVEREYELALLAAAQPAQKEISLALIDEANRRRELALATIEQSRALEDAQKKIDANPDAAGGGGLGFHGMTSEQAEANRRELEALGKKNAKRAADDQEDVMTTAWRNIAENVDTITTNMFDEMLDKGKISIKSLADGIGDMFRTTIAGAMGDVVSAPLKNIAQQAAAGQLKMPAGGFAFNQMGQAGASDYGMAAGLGGAGGYVAGSVYAQAAGKQDTYAATGGAVGGALGAAAGMYFGPGGAVAGGMLGSMAGSFIGGMFGGEGLGNDQSVQKFGSAVGKAIWSDKSFSEENRKVTGGIIEQLGMLGEALKATGANINDVQIELAAGNKSGIRVQGQQYGDAQEALVGAIKIMLQQTGGLQGSQATALQNTRGRGVQEVMQDLAFAKEFDKITFSGTVAEAAMRDLTEQFDATGRKAHELGLDEAALAAARTRAMDQLMLAAQRQQRALASQFTIATTADPLEQQVLGIWEQFQGLTDTLTDAGYSAEQLAQVQQAAIRQQDEVRRQDADRRRAEAQAAAEQRRAQAEAAKQAAEQRRAAAEAARLAAIEDQRRRRGLISQFTIAVSQNPLEQQLLGIWEQFMQLSDTLKDAGFSAKQLMQVQKAAIRQQDEAVKQEREQAASLQKDLQSRVLAIGSFYDQLIEPLEAVNQNSLLNPAGQIGAARGTFQSDLAKAQAGDPDAVRRLAGSAGQFQGLVAQNYGTAGQGSEYLREIRGGVGGAIANLQQERAVALADLPTVVQQTSMDQIREQKAEIAKVVEQLELLRRDLRGRGIAA